MHSGRVLTDMAALHIKCDELTQASKVLAQARRQLTESNDLIGQARALLKFGILKYVYAYTCINLAFPTTFGERNDSYCYKCLCFWDFANFQA